MPSLYQVLRELESVYLNETSSSERYMILQQVEETIKNLRQETINTMVNREFKVEDHTMNKLRKIFADQSGSHIDVINEYVKPEASIQFLVEELQMDSLDMIEIIMAVEEEFDVEIDDWVAESFRTVDDILRAVTH